MRFGGCGREYHVRLFRKSSASYEGKMIHEKISFSGDISVLVGHVDHYSYESFNEYFIKFNEYTTRIAEEKYKSGKRFHVWHLIRLPYEFIMRYVIKLGFLDGLPGFLYALVSSFYALMKYIKLLDFEKEQSSEHIFRCCVLRINMCAACRRW